MARAMKPVGFETLTVTNAAVGPTASSIFPSGGLTADFAIFGPTETAQIRWRGDGTAPTASVGHLLEVGTILEYSGDLSKIQFIRTGGTSGSLPCDYYNRGAD